MGRVVLRYRCHRPERHPTVRPSRGTNPDLDPGALPPPVGTIMWAEENKGAYERNIGGEHGTDVPIRVDRSLIGKRSIAEGQVTGVQDFVDVTRAEARAQSSRAASLATELGIQAAPLQAEGPFAYGLVARGEAQLSLCPERRVGPSYSDLRLASPAAGPWAPAALRPPQGRSTRSSRRRNRADQCRPSRSASHAPCHA